MVEGSVPQPDSDPPQPTLLLSLLRSDAESDADAGAEHLLRKRWHKPDRSW